MARFSIEPASRVNNFGRLAAKIGLRIVGFDCETGHEIRYPALRLTDENIDGLREMLEPIFERRRAELSLQVEAAAHEAKARHAREDADRIRRGVDMFGGPAY